MEITKVNPSKLFYSVYEKNILKSREALFEELNKSSTDFGVEARKLLAMKLEANNNTPLLGELFPWIIKDLINADVETTHNISVGWLAIYLYTLFLDEYVDNPKPISSNMFITSSLLAKIGLLNFARLTSNTPYENFIDRVFTHSAENQQLDIKYQKIDYEVDFKEKYSEGKNYIVLACAGALAAQNSRHSEFILNFTKELLLTLQYLDDVADFKDDFSTKNFTVLLNDAFKGKPNIFSSNAKISNTELLIELIETGALSRVIGKILKLLNQSISLINEYNREKTSSASDYFHRLFDDCSILNNYLKENQFLIRSLPIKHQFIVLDKVEKLITIIAQSS